MTTDWSAWHDPYADAGSALSRRLRVVQRLVHGWLDDTSPGTVSVLSTCSGDGRDVLGALADRTDAARVVATLLDIDPRNVDRAERRIHDLGLPGVRAVCADAGRSNAYVGLPPADLVLACGIFGNISDRDVHRFIAALPQLCAPGALVIWTRHRSAPDLTPRIREWLGRNGFEEKSFTAPDDVLFTVGAHRFQGEAATLVPDQVWFSFTR